MFLPRALGHRIAFQTGDRLEVSATILRTVYETGLQVAESVKHSIRCLRDRMLGEWNYRILPQAT